MRNPHAMHLHVSAWHGGGLALCPTPSSAQRPTAYGSLPPPPPSRSLPSSKRLGHPPLSLLLPPASSQHHTGITTLLNPSPSPSPSPYSSPPCQRHSGTTYMLSFLKTNLDPGITLEDRLCAIKHRMQVDEGQGGRVSVGGGGGEGEGRGRAG